MTATHEFVVPRSIPITFAIPKPFFVADRPGPERHPVDIQRNARIAAAAPVP
jgi:hypothetical protein